jgi:flotillin
MYHLNPLRNRNTDKTQVQKTERDSERAQAEATLATRKTVFNRDVSIAQIEANRATESRDEELRKDVEVKRAITELERLRASDVVKATIAREAKQQAADAKLYEEKAKAQASQFAEQTAADAHAYTLKINAEAAYTAAAKDAEAQLIRQQKEAAGMSAMAGAYADLSRAFGGPSGLIQYLMIEKGVYTDLAKANADAVRGLNPKMTIWNTGAQAGSEGAAAEGTGMGGVDSIRNMYQMLPPLMSTINEQTGIVLPEWQFGKLAGQMSEREVNGKTITGMNGNGVKDHK